MARKKKVSKTLAAAKIDLDRRVEEGDEAATAIRDGKWKRAGDKHAAKTGLKAAREAYRGSKSSMTWTTEGREIVRQMRATRTTSGRKHFVGEGDIAKVRKHISKWETFNGYGTADLTPGQVIMVTSTPYNPYGDGLRVDVLRGLDEIIGVPLAKLVQLPREENN